MIYGMTPAQARVLIVIQSALEETGIAPTFEELRVALNLANKSTVHLHVHALVKKGWLAADPHCKRGLAVRRRLEPDQCSINLPQALRRMADRLEAAGV